MASSSYPGVSYDKQHGRWKARVKLAGRWVSAGYHATPELAHAAIRQVQQDAPVRPAAEPPLPANHPELIKKAQQTRFIAKHNLLVETPTIQTLLEAKVFALMLRSIGRENRGEPPTAVIPLRDLFPTGSFGGQQRQLLDEAMTRLMAAHIRIPKLNENDFHLISLCDSIWLDSKKRLLVASFGPAVLAYLLNLVGNFTRADVDELLTIRSVSAHKLYWLMSRWQFKSPHTIPVQTLKALTAPGNTYSQYADFRNKVLKPSVAELNELSFDITYLERRQRGRAVTDITFNIGRKEEPVRRAGSPPTAVPAAPVAQLSPLQQKVQTRLQKLKLTEAQIRRVLQVLGREEALLTKLLKETYPVLRDFETKARPGENVAASAVGILKSAFPTLWATEQRTAQ